MPQSRTSENPGVADVVSLCTKGNCCPQLVLNKDGSVRLLSDDCNQIDLTREQAEVLARVLANRGYCQ